LKLSGERSRSRRPGRYLFMEAGALRPAGLHRGGGREEKLSMDNLQIITTW